ncbi:glycoside hydrolase [Hysterangium stoloniferum]|nr:glycoside hydrolase [Hysterangium stoloniferum]
MWMILVASLFASFVASAWFAGWHANTGFPVSSISWDKYTHMTYAFATTTPDVNTLEITPDDEIIIPEFVAMAHQKSVTVSISVGGWTGSRFFSTAVGSAQNRTAFLNTLSNFVKKYGFDGIDFDWEYPNRQGVGCNTISSQDTANFLLLLRMLRQNSDTSKLILSAATSISPFADSTGLPSASVADFAEVLDYIEVMNYDIWGSWSTAVGPNAPLNDSCAAAPNKQGSAVSAVAAWTQAGMPFDKIILGVASYGHSYSLAPADAIQTTGLVEYPKFIAENQPAGDAWDDAAGPDVCGVEQRVGGSYNFWGLVKNGFLDTNGYAATNITYRFDNCSQTAYVYDPSKQIEVSFDDVPAFTAKGKFIDENSLRGFAMWEAGGDYDDLLLDAIRSGAGLEDDCCD